MLSTIGAFIVGAVVGLVVGGIIGVTRGKKYLREIQEELDKLRS